MLNTTIKRGQSSGDRQREQILRGASLRATDHGKHHVCAHCGTHLRPGSERGQGDCVRPAGNLERGRCVTRRCQEDETEGTTHWLRASNVDRCSRP